MFATTLSSFIIWRLKCFLTCKCYNFAPFDAVSNNKAIWQFIRLAKSVFMQLYEKALRQVPKLGHSQSFPSSEKARSKFPKNSSRCNIGKRKQRRQRSRREAKSASSDWQLAAERLIFVGGLGIKVLWDREKSQSSVSCGTCFNPDWEWNSDRMWWWYPEADLAIRHGGKGTMKDLLRSEVWAW